MSRIFIIPETKTLNVRAPNDEANTILSGPQGPVGPTGPTGPIGDKGAKGPTGSATLPIGGTIDQRLEKNSSTTGDASWKTTPLPTNDTIDNTILSNMPATTFKGNNTAAVADPKDLTALEARTSLGVQPWVQMEINERTVSGNGNGLFASGWTIIPTLPGTAISCTKVLADSVFMVTLHIGFYVDQAGVTFSFGVRVVGVGDYLVMDAASNVANSHDCRSGVFYTPAFAVGTYGFYPIGYGKSSFNLRFDGNDTISMHVREVRRS